MNLYPRRVGQFNIAILHLRVQTTYAAEQRFDDFYLWPHDRRTPWRITVLHEHGHPASLGRTVVKCHSVVDAIVCYFHAYVFIWLADNRKNASLLHFLCHRVVNGWHRLHTCCIGSCRPMTRGYTWLIEQPNRLRHDWSQKKQNLKNALSAHYIDCFQYVTTDLSHHHYCNYSWNYDWLNHRSGSWVIWLQALTYDPLAVHIRQLWSR